MAESLKLGKITLDETKKALLVVATFGDGKAVCEMTVKYVIADGKIIAPDLAKPVTKVINTLAEDKPLSQRVKRLPQADYEKFPNSAATRFLDDLIGGNSDYVALSNMIKNWLKDNSEVTFNTK
jgi:hypothetical protein